MDDARVLDASVFAALVFSETATAAARARLNSRMLLSAPDLIFAEFAHVGLKKIRRGEFSTDQVRRALTRLLQRVSDVEPSARYASRAIELAALHGLTGYDGVYLAMAEARATPLLTADLKLADRAERAGLGALIERVQA